MVQRWAASSVVDQILGVWVGAYRWGPRLFDITYSDGTPLGSYVPPWAPNEPNDGSGVEDCIEMAVFTNADTPQAGFQSLQSSV
jgi:hypothetical protein